MPMMADLQDPPRSRARGFLIGLTVAVPLVLLIGLWLLPFLHAQLVGGAEDFDARLRQEDAYMHGVCNEALVVDRDEALCSCALGAEFPSLDCRAPFMRWSLDRQSEQCADTSIAAEAVSFCACVDALIEMVESAPDEKTARQTVQRYARCAELEDAIYLPTLDQLSPESPATGAPTP
ncbi:MAG: hypothetical protein ACYTFT_07940 [Planctomycetota bacterium]|jgi:hypothetical protein